VTEVIELTLKSVPRVSTVPWVQLLRINILARQENTAHQKDCKNWKAVWTYLQAIGVILGQS
jgi:hypothetical protein